MTEIIFAGSECQALAKEVADEMEVTLGNSTIKNFPDGEMYVRIESDVKGKKCAVVQSTSRPHNSNLVELLIMLDTLKELGAREVTAVVPYFGYGRQDKSFNLGEAVTARTAARHIQLNADRFLTINLHKKSILEFFKIPAEAIDASSVLGEYFKTHNLEKPVVIGPDKGATELAGSVAKVIGCEFDYLEKERIGPANVRMKPKKLDIGEKDVILIDDIIDSGNTVLETVKMLRAQNANSILIGCVHPVLTGNIVTRLFATGATDIVATNTIQSQISYITVSSLIVEALKSK